MGYDRQRAAQRLEDLRRESGLSLAKLSQAIQEKTGVYISGTQLQKYENTEKITRDGRVETITDLMNVKNAIAIADFYGVSYDYILGLGARKRENHNIVEETGLSEKAVEKLKTWVEKVKEPDANGVQVTRIVNTKAPEEISLLLENSKLRTLVRRLRALRHLAGEEVAGEFYPGPAKTQVFREEFGARDAWEYVLFQAVNTFQEVARDMAPAPAHETRKATQADMDDF